MKTVCLIGSTCPFCNAERQKKLIEKVFDENRAFVFSREMAIKIGLIKEDCNEPHIHI